MRVLVLIKATPASEAGVPPSTELLEAMGRYNEELANAGVLLAGEGLQPSAKGVRVRLTDDHAADRPLTRGPFPATGELVAGFWMWRVASMDDAVAWARRCPNPMPGTAADLEIRPVFEADDFGDELTPELREQEAALRARV